MNKEMEWVASVVNQNDVREYLRYMISDGLWMYGTDGHRIHRVKARKPKGYYSANTGRSVKGAGIERLAYFLKTMRKHFKGFAGGMESFDPKELPEAEPFKEDRTKRKRKVINGVTFNGKYVHEATLGRPFKAKTKEVYDPLQGEGELGQFLIMPLRVA